MIGRRAGTSTTTGRGNIYFGAESGETNVEGSYNIGIGFQALNKFDKDSADTSENGFNIAIGYQAGSNIGVNSSALGLLVIHLKTLFWVIKHFLKVMLMKIMLFLVLKL